MDRKKGLLIRGLTGGAEVQYELGDRYYHGWGVEENRKKAIRWYKRAARKKHVLAQYALGMHYFIENGKKATLWLDLATKQGLPDAKIWLGECYCMTGNHLYHTASAENKEEAVKMYKLAAEQGNERATMMLENIGKFDSYKALAEQGDKEAQYRLGVCYYFGIDTNKNQSESEKWLRLAAEQGVADAKYRLGELYYHNRFEKRENEKETFKWFCHAAEQGCVKAQYSVGKCYYFGIGTDKDGGESARWYRIAAEHGDEEAQYELGGLYSNGTHVEKDMKEAEKWFRLSAEQGNASAQSQLGRIYYDGDFRSGIKKDTNEALKWLRLAAIKLSNPGLRLLKDFYEYEN